MTKEELEKENEELKDKLEILIAVGNTCTKGLNKQLTKAKEIIKKLYSHVFRGMGFMDINDYNVQKAEAEQFIIEAEAQSENSTNKKLVE